MKKFLHCGLVLLCMCFIFACHGRHCHGAESQNFKVLASTFPIYLFTANVCKDVKNVSVELLIPAAAGCPHDFALRPADMLKLANASVLVINGAGLEDFLLKPLESLSKTPLVIDAGLNVKLLPGVEQDHHGHDNPHIFAGPAQASLMVLNIATGLARFDALNADQYMANAEKYAESLSNLSGQLQKVGQQAKNPKIALDHDALAYLAENANLHVSAIFENVDSVARVARLKKELEADKPALLAGDSQYPSRMLKTLAEEVKIPFELLDPCANGPENPPLDYYNQVMKKNLEILEKAFDK